MRTLTLSIQLSIPFCITYNFIILTFRNNSRADFDILIVNRKNEDDSDENHNVADYMNNKTEFTFKIYEALRECIKHHQEILR